MPIIVKCKCGGKFKARDELAGKRLICPNCGTPVNIPAQPNSQGKESRNNEPKTSTQSKVKCSCGQAYAVSNSMVGKVVKCRKCGSKINIGGSVAQQTSKGSEPENESIGGDDFAGLDLSLAESTADPFDDPLGAPTSAAPSFQPSAFQPTTTANNPAGGGFKFNSTLILVVSVAVGILLLVVCGIGGYVAFFGNSNNVVASNSDNTSASDDGFESDGSSVPDSDSDVSLQGSEVADDSNTGDSTENTNNASAETSPFLKTKTEFLTASHDGSLVATISPKSKTLTVWNSASGKESVKLSDQHKTAYVAFSSDNALIASAGRNEDKNELRIWDLKSGEVISSTTVDRTGPIRFASDKGAIFCSQSSRGVAVMDPATGASETIGSERKFPTAFAISPERNIAAVLVAAVTPGRASPAFYDVDIYDLTTRETVLQLKSPDITYTMAFSPNGDYLAGAGFSKIVVWDIRSETKVAEFENPTKAKTERIALTNDGKQVVTLSNHLIHVWRATTSVAESLNETQVDSFLLLEDGTLMLSSLMHPIRLVKP